MEKPIPNPFVFHTVALDQPCNILKTYIIGMNKKQMAMLWIQQTKIYKGLYSWKQCYNQNTIQHVHEWNYWCLLSLTKYLKLYFNLVGIVINHANCTMFYDPYNTSQSYHSYMKSHCTCGVLSQTLTIAIFPSSNDYQTKFLEKNKIVKNLKNLKPFIFQILPILLVLGKFADTFKVLYFSMYMDKVASNYPHLLVNH